MALHCRSILPPHWHSACFSSWPLLNSEEPLCTVDHFCRTSNLHSPGSCNFNILLSTLSSASPPRYNRRRHSTKGLPPHHHRLNELCHCFLGRGQFAWW